MDDFTLAVDCWNSKETNERDFAKYAARVSGERTKDLAAACKCSPDKVENYRRAYTLYYELQREIEHPDISRVWSENNISFWIESAKLQSKHGLDLPTIYNHMKDGDGLSIEAYRTFVDGVCDTRPEWLRRLLTIRTKLQKLYSDYMSEMPPSVQEEFRQAIAEFEQRLERMTDDSVYPAEGT